MNEQPPVTYAHRTVQVTRLGHLTRSLYVQISALVFLVSVLLWTLLFTGYGGVHDPLHALRHALYLIPCH